MGQHALNRHKESLERVSWAQTLFDIEGYPDLICKIIDVQAPSRRIDIDFEAETVILRGAWVFTKDLLDCS